MPRQRDRRSKPNPNSAAPDPATSYERAKPEKEAGMGRLDNDECIPANRPDQMDKAVKNRQPLRQINAHDVTDDRKTADPARAMSPPEPVDHSMKQEEPLGWDQAPQEKKPQRDRRQPKTLGRGGTD